MTVFNPKRIPKTLAVLLLPALSCAAVADTSMRYNLNGQPGFTIRIHGAQIGIFKNDKLTLLYDDGAKSYTFVDHPNRVYTVISEQWMQEATRRSQEVYKQMQAKMEKQAKNLPPQYQQMFQQGKTMMPFMMPMMNIQAQPTQPAMHMPAFGPGRAGQYPCRRMDVMQGGKKNKQVCVASPASLGVAGGDWNTFRAMLATNDRLAKQGAFTFGFNAPLIAAPGGGLQGIPVEIKDNDAATTLLLSDIDSAAVNPAGLRPPKGFLEARIPIPGL